MDPPVWFFAEDSGQNILEVSVVYHPVIKNASNCAEPMKRPVSFEKKIMKTINNDYVGALGEENGKFAIKFAKKICNFWISMLYCMGVIVII